MIQELPLRFLCRMGSLGRLFHKAQNRTIVVVQDWG